MLPLDNVLDSARGCSAAGIRPATIAMATIATATIATATIATTAAIAATTTDCARQFRAERTQDHL